MSHFFKPSSDCHPTQNKSQHLYNGPQGPICSGPYNLFNLISNQSLAYSLHSSYSAPLVFKNSSHIPTSEPLNLLFLPEILFPKCQPASLSHLLYVSTQSLCLSKTLPIGLGQMPILLPALPFLCFFFPDCISLHLAYIFYRLLITTKNVNFYKSMSLSVLFDSVPSTPRILETDVAPIQYPLLNKGTPLRSKWNNVKYIPFMASARCSRNINFCPHFLAY